MITNGLHVLEWLFCRTLSYHLSTDYNRCSYLRGRFLGLFCFICFMKPHELSWIVRIFCQLATRYLSWSAADDDLQRSDARAAKRSDMRRDAWKITIYWRYVLNCFEFLDVLHAGWMGLSVCWNILLPTTDVAVVISSDGKSKRHEFELAGLAHVFEVDLSWGFTWHGWHFAQSRVELMLKHKCSCIKKASTFDVYNYNNLIDMIDMIELGVELRTQLCKTEHGMSHGFLLHISWSRMIPHF